MRTEQQGLHLDLRKSWHFVQNGHILLSLDHPHCVSQLMQLNINQFDQKTGTTACNTCNIRSHYVVVWVIPTVKLIST
jgi:hypothetical protein